MQKAAGGRRHRDIFVLDTNVLLYNPKAIFAFPGADVIIPDQVLAELDRLKTTRADKELRFRGREFSRILFDLSESGKLTEGVKFGEDSRLRVVIFDPHKVPESLSGKNTDDRILGIVYQLQKEKPGRGVTIVTNDLNMLVKAQMLDIPVTHSGEEFAYGRLKRSFVWLNTQKKALSAIAVILVLATAIVFSQNIYDTAARNQTQTPARVRAQLQQIQAQEQQLKAQENGYQMILDRNPKDLQSLIGLGNVNFDRGEVYQDPKYYQKAVDYYLKALEIDPKNVNARLYMGIEYYKLAMFDIALGEFKKIISYQPNNELAHFYAGSILMQKSDYKGALPHLKKYQEIAPNGSAAGQVAHFLEQIPKELLKQ
ncbi:MAG: PIN domain-containing protein [Actinobacteria bacterium]|nr:PIN domain-containing protein [Actinomycetota bacterium]